MPPALAYARAAEPKLLASFDAYAARRGLHGPNQLRAARAFLRRWPEPQAWAVEPLSVRLALPTVTRSFLMFLLLGGHLHPGYDYLVRRKLTSFWRDVPHFSMAKHTTRFLDAAARLGFTERTRSATASQVIGRLLIQTGRGLDQLVEDDFEELLAACRERQDCDGIGPHYRRAVHTARQVLFHLEVFDTQPVNAISLLRQSFEQRMHAATPRLRPTFVAYLDRLTATHARNTVTGTASRLNDFAAHLAAIDPDLPSVAELDRRRHIETYLTATAEAVNSRTGRRCRPPNAAPGYLRCTACSTTSPSGDGLRHRHGGWCSAPTSRSCRVRCPATSPRTWTGSWPTRCRPARTGSARMRYSYNAPPVCASASWSTSNSTACTRSPDRARG
jgi:hypothetical protein